MKTRSQKKWFRRTLKNKICLYFYTVGAWSHPNSKWHLSIVEDYVQEEAAGRLSEGLGRCPKNLQGTRPLTRALGSAQTRPRRRQEKEL